MGKDASAAAENNLQHLLKTTFRTSSFVGEDLPIDHIVYIYTVLTIKFQVK